MSEEPHFVDIDENHTWKDEVAKLLGEMEYMEKEVIASQMMAGLILQQVGEVFVSKKAIATGLAGKHIDFEESEDGVTFRLVND